jgi:hypothetical protein
MKHVYKLVAGLMLLGSSTSAQELFVYTEPASNMPAHSIGLRLNQWFMNEAGVGLNYHLLPEVMWGVNKALMLHTEAFVSNRGAGGLRYEGVGAYAKYRFYSHDGDHRHFRAAAFARGGVNNADIHQDEIETNGHNTGGELGLIGTQLLNRTALSATASAEHALDNRQGKEAFPDGAARTAINGTLSAGHLFLPHKYTGYDQVNFNGMVELLGQWLPENGKYYLDVAPSIQLIFHSQTRVDVGYRFSIAESMVRTAPSGFLVRVEHLLFGAL